MIKKLRWTYVTIFSILMILFGQLLFRRWNHLHLNWLLACSLIFLKYAEDWPTTRTRLQHQSRQRTSILKTIGALLPPIIPAFFKLQIDIFSGFFAFLRRQKSPVDSLHGSAFSYLLNGQYNTFITIIFLSTIVDIPFAAFMVNVFEKDPDTRIIIHCTILLLTIYTLIAVLSDRWRLRACHHVVGDQYLHLRLGFRFSADIPFEQINKITMLNDSKRIWCAKNKISFLDEFTVSPIDQPQILIEMKPHSLVKMESLKMLQDVPRFLFLYVDKPQALIGVIEPRLTKSN